MLGKTAGGLYWMFRFLERSENTARLLEAGFRMALTRSSDTAAEWESVVTTSGALQGYSAKYDGFTDTQVMDYLLRDIENPSSVMSVTKAARDNARIVRTALTTEVWEAVNDNWMTLRDLLDHPVTQVELPETLAVVRQQSALVRGALYGTMLRNDIYDFARLGTFVERADNTARIIDVKYYTLLPSASAVGSSLDNVQWEMILRSVSAHRSFRWLDEKDMTATAIAEFLIFDKRLPRSLAYSAKQTVENLTYLEQEYGTRHICHDLADALRAKLKTATISTVFDEGLHDFITDFIRDNNALGAQIERDFRFNG
ncbi:alpha-E domain-containing protein [Sulfitobacter sabulilitoris]|uniref:Alpha-E domain-containing protein n=1 Tax=Sulfitobacter sabulilitoris TaxID=2562655 RepID=A0A5S3PCX3_9RHOB|nr:alpha-E domain-containing protein [Sulfitobacter sabulilitoris]TMM51676.1 alpha-E domain-containing protein [Sulfitobacter sabulilitoris]